MKGFFEGMGGGGGRGNGRSARSEIKKCLGWRQDALRMCL